MSNSEINRPSQEIGKREIAVFAAKVTSLVSKRPEKPDKILGEELHVWDAKYTKNNIDILLTIPEPGHKFSEFPNPFNSIVARVSYPPFSTADNGHTLSRKKLFQLDLNSESMEYEEEIDEHDQRGQRVRPARQQRNIELCEQGDFMSFIKNISSRLEDEKTLGANIVTHERYEELMKLLNSLTTSDQILKN